MALGQIIFPVGKSAIPESINGIVITDVQDVQYIFAFIIGGIFTLTIFSYTMVMNVLNRSINNYSPRLIPLILSERHHQLILGFTSGTIIYSMILSIAVSSDNVPEIPPLAATLGVLLSIFCVFLFIYFIHSVSQSIHINYILRKSYTRSRDNLKELFAIQKLGRKVDPPSDMKEWTSINTDDCGYLQMPQVEALAQKAASEKSQIWIEPTPGTFVLENSMLIKTSKNLDNRWKKRDKQVSIDSRVALEMHETEMKHLVEVAVKACSPAINDPGTSLGAIDYLTQLFMMRNRLQDFNAYTIDDQYYVFIKHIEQKEFTYWCYSEMWHYMKNDPVLKETLKRSLKKVTDDGLNLSFEIFNTN
jgi:uncharacterized membrane protein